MLLTTALPYATLLAGPQLEELPPFPAPPNTSRSWIAKNIVMNNTPMSLQEFIYSGNSEQFEAFYRQQWPGPIFNKSYFGDETLLGYMDSSYFYSVRFKEKLGRITGQMTVSKINQQGLQRLTTELPLPLGSTIKQIIHARDLGKLSESVTVTNKLSKNGNARYMLTELNRLGWRLHGNREEIEKTSPSGALQLEFSKQSAQLQITLTEQQNPTDQITQMLIHWIK